MATCQELLEQAREKLVEFDNFAEAVTTGKITSGVILHKNKRAFKKSYGFTVAMGQNHMKCFTLPDDPNKYKVGDLVIVVNNIIMGPEEVPVLGDMHMVLEGVFEDRVTVDVGGNSRTVFANGFDDIHVGDKVILDPSKWIVLGHHKTKKTTYEAPLQQVPWDSIGGLADAKLALQDSIEAPRKFANLFRGYGQKPPRGVLLLGPPGCGKTMLAKAAATSIAEMSGGSAGSGFIYLKGPEVLSKWVGESEATVRGLFAQARKHKATYGYDAVIFIDEAEAILGTRSGSLSNNGLTATIVPTFLAELDGLDDPACVMILATNRPELLDSAVVRDGRIDRKILVSRPDRVTAKEILQLHMGNSAVWPESIADYIVERVWSTDYKLFTATSNKGKHDGYLSHAVSGAMLGGLVSRARTYAINRDVRASRRTPSGVRPEDVTQALLSTWHEMKHTRMDEIAVEVCSNVDAKLVNFTIA